MFASFSFVSFLSQLQDCTVNVSCNNGAMYEQWRTGMLVLLEQYFLIELRLYIPQYTHSVPWVESQEQQCLIRTGLSVCVHLCLSKGNNHFCNDTLRSP